MSTRAIATYATAADLLSLTKPRLSSLVLFTMAGGMWLAPAGMSAARAAATLLSTAGIIGAANALNCYFERDTDRLMKRTRNRPLPAGRIDPPVALWFAISLAAISLPTLALASNLLTAVLGIAALVLYVFAYTPLKARTWLAMLVGAVPGALPTLMGWTAASGSIAVPGLVLFAILYVWQIPHFVAIALFCKEDYRAAGLTSLPLARGDAVAGAYSAAFCALLIPISFMLFPLKVAGPIYAASALVLGAAFLGTALIGFWRRLASSGPRQLFYMSLLYMAGLFIALWVDGARHVDRWNFP